MADDAVRQKLAAILAADVAGYARLMGEDEPATIATLRAHREVFRGQIESHGGRVVDTADECVAARLEGLAEPGGVMISEFAYQQVRRDPDLADAGAHEVKNIADPVRAFRVLKAGAEPTPAPKRGKRPLALAAAAAVVVIAGLGAW